MLVPFVSQVSDFERLDMYHICERTVEDEDEDEVWPPLRHCHVGVLERA